MGVCPECRMKDAQMQVLAAQNASLRLTIRNQDDEIALIVSMMRTSDDELRRLKIAVLQRGGRDNGTALPAK